MKERNTASNPNSPLRTGRGSRRCGVSARALGVPLPERLDGQVVLLAEAAGQRHLKSLPLRVGLQAALTAQVVLLALQLLVHVAHVGVGPPVHGAPVDVVAVLIVRHDEHADIRQGAQVDEVAERVTNEALVDEREEEPLDQLDQEVGHGHDGEAQDTAEVAHILGRVVCGKLALWIGSCQVLEAQDFQEEQNDKQLELEVDFTGGLELVPLVCDEECAPDADGRIDCPTLPSLAWLAHPPSGPLPVDEEDVDADLRPEHVDEVKELEDEGDNEEVHKELLLRFCGQQPVDCLLSFEENQPLDGEAEDYPEYPCWQAANEVQRELE